MYGDNRMVIFPQCIISLAVIGKLQISEENQDDIYTMEPYFGLNLRSIHFIH